MLASFLRCPAFLFSACPLVDNFFTGFFFARYTHACRSLLCPTRSSSTPRHPPSFPVRSTRASCVQSLFFLVATRAHRIHLTNSRTQRPFSFALDYFFSKTPTSTSPSLINFLWPTRAHLVLPPVPYPSLSSFRLNLRSKYSSTNHSTRWSNLNAKNFNLLRNSFSARALSLKKKKFEIYKLICGPHYRRSAWRGWKCHRIVCVWFG